MYSCWSMWPSLPCVQQETLFTSSLRKTFPKRFLKSVCDCTQTIKFNFIFKKFTKRLCVYLTWNFSFCNLWTVIFYNSFLTHFCTLNTISEKNSLKKIWEIFHLNNVSRVALFYLFSLILKSKIKCIFHLIIFEFSFELLIRRNLYDWKGVQPKHFWTINSWKQANYNPYI